MEISSGGYTGMLTRIYALTWALGILSALLFYITGNLTHVVSVTFGLLTVGMILMGMTGVLPSTFAEENEREIKERRRRREQYIELTQPENVANVTSRSERVYADRPTLHSRPQLAIR